jgi:CheY-like chemotaxis protein
MGQETESCMKISFIDDSRETLTQFLEGLPRDTIVEVQAIDAEFFNPAVAAALARFQPDLIILDLLLKEDMESGFRVLRKLKTSDNLKGIPVVVCSKYISDTEKGRETAARAVSLGAIAALSKIPFPSFEHFAKLASGTVANGG